MIVVFYGNQVYGEYSDWDDMQEIPIGAYAYDYIFKAWWYYHNAWLIESESNVPAVCKAWLLIL